jgi:hypothetical protein
VRVTAVPASDRISELRDLFRYLSEFRACHELTGLEDITTPYGNTWSLWDLEYLYRAACERLTMRQQQAITLCLIHGIKESDAAELMGVSRSNPVMMYASLGIQRLLDMIDYGELDRFNKPRLRPEDASRRREIMIKELAQIITSKIIEINGCWLFPNRFSRPPRVLLRAPQTSTGYILVSPMQILWQDQIGPVPPGCRVEHQIAIPAVSIACVNPIHGELIMSAQRKAWLQSLAKQYIRSREVSA